MKKREFGLIVTFFATPAIVILKATYTHEHDTLVLPETRMIEGGNSKYHDSLEELFINTADSKVIRYKVFTLISDSKCPETSPNRDVLYIFGFTHLNESLTL